MTMSMHRFDNGICLDCEPGMERSGETGEERKYNPLQPRDPGGENGGQWTKSPAGEAKAAVKDVLKLAGKIDLADDEELLGSAKLDGDGGGIRMALIRKGGDLHLRLGAGGERYGKPNREDGIKAWDGNPSRAALPRAERERLGAEYDRLDAEYDSASPARRQEISHRQDAIRQQLADDGTFNGTATLDAHGMSRLADRIGPAMADAVEEEKSENDAWDQLQALQRQANPDPQQVARLRELARADATDPITFVSGVIPGSAWGDIHYEVLLDDLSVGPELSLGVAPKGAPDSWGAGLDWRGTFNAAETRKFLKTLDKLTAAAE